MRNDTKYSQFEDISANSFIGRLTGTGSAINLTATEATSILNTFTTTEKGLVPFSGGGTTNFLRADGTWAAPPGGGGSGITDGNKGDITVASSGTNWTVNASAITFAKMQNSAAGLSVIGRAGNSSGVFAEITAGSDGQILRRSGSTIGFGTIVTAGIADSQITYQKIQDVTSSTLLGRYSVGNGVAQEITLGSGLSLDTGTGVLTASMSGSGTSGQVAYWNGTGSITGEAGFEYDVANNRLAVTALDLGTSSVSGATRTFRAQGSATDVGLDIRCQGAGILQVIAGGQLTLTSQTAHTSIAGSNISLHVSSPNFQSMVFGMYIGNANTVPTGNPADGIFTYATDISSSSVLHIRNEAGDIIKLYTPNSGSAYSVSNLSTDRSYNADSTTLDEIADVLGSLITDLKATGLIA